MYDEYADTSKESRRRQQVIYSLKSHPTYDTFEASQIAGEIAKFGIFTLRTTQQEQALLQTHGRDKMDYRMFCSTPFYEPSPSCIMDVDSILPDGGSDYRDELCSKFNHAGATYTFDNQAGVVVRTLNKQTSLHGESCRSTATKTTLSAYGFTINLDERLAPQPTNIEFEEKDSCTEVVVLLLDKSGSMAGSRMAYLKSAAIRLIDSLDDETKLGIVWFDSQPRAAVGIQELGESRHLAQQAIDSISASGGTRIGFGLGVAYEQIRLLRDPDQPRPKETIFLVTDGESQDDTTSVVEIISRDNVKISTVALGDDTDAYGLFQMARQTGGESYFAQEDTDISRSVVSGALKTLENYEILSDTPASATGRELVFEVDAYVETLSLQIDLAGINPLELNDSGFVLTDELGASVARSIRISNLTENTATLVVNFRNDHPGNYRLLLPTKALTTESTSALLVLGQSPTLQWNAYLESGNTIVSYPDQVVLAGSIEASLGSAHELSVTATVTGPDGSVRQVSLYDDGSSVHGDDLANDGLYHRRLGGLNEPGTYSVIVSADNSNEAAYRGDGQHTDYAQPPQKFSSFARQAQLSFEIQNYVEPQPSSVRITTLERSLPEQDLPLDVAPEVGVTLAGFHLDVGPGQGVRITKLKIAVEGEEKDLEALRGFDIYIDSDGDGIVDSSGPTARPIGSVEARREGGAFVLADVLELPGETAVDVLLVGRYQRRESTTVSETEVAAAWLFFPFPLLLLPYFTRKTGKRWAALSLVLVAAGLLAGCGDSRENYVFTGSAPIAKAPPAPTPSPSPDPLSPTPTPTSSPTPPTTTVENREMRVHLDWSQVEAVGRLDDRPVTVEVPTPGSAAGAPVHITETVPSR